MRLNQHARAKADERGIHFSADQAQAHDDYQKRENGVHLSPDGRIQNQGRVEKICGRHKKSPVLRELFFRFPIQNQPAAHIAEDGGDFQQKQMGQGVIGHAGKVPDGSQQPQNIHVARRIVRKRVRGVEPGRAYLEHPVSPGGKTRRVIVKAF